MEIPSEYCKQEHFISILLDTFMEMWAIDIQLLQVLTGYHILVFYVGSKCNR